MSYHDEDVQKLIDTLYSVRTQVENMKNRYTANGMPADVAVELVSPVRVLTRSLESMANMTDKSIVSFCKTELTLRGYTVIDDNQ